MNLNEDCELKKPKRRFRVYNSTFHIDKVTLSRKERKRMIRLAEKYKPHKKRAIQRARDLKMDEGRGQEAPVDMWSEFLSSMLSSRESHPFSVVHTYTVTTYLRSENYPGMKPVMNTQQDVIARGTIYKAHKKNDIVVLNELRGTPIRRFSDECKAEDIAKEIQRQYYEYDHGTFTVV
jgi:hypothetical protein